MLWLWACTTTSPPEPARAEPAAHDAPTAEVAPTIAGLALLRDPSALPDLDIRPRYTLDLSISDTESRYEGRGTLRWTNRTGEVISSLPLRLPPNEPDEAGAATKAHLELVSVTGGEAERRRESLVVVTLDRPVRPREAVELAFEFRGTLQRLEESANDVWAQMGAAGGAVEAADYGLLGQGDGLLTASSAYPMVAPWTEDGFDVTPPSGIGDLVWSEPMVFEVRVVTPPGLEVVTNLVDAPPERLDGGQLVRAEGAGVRDFVLVASRDFEVSETVIDDVTVRSWSLSRDAEAGRAALASATRALEAFDRRIAPYPFTEFDVVEATLTGGAGGVEFSSLVLIAGFLYRDPSTSQDPNAQMLQQLGGLGMPDLGGVLAEQRDFVVAHEVAHQWFPGLVGSDARAAPAVDEPLAQYLAGTLVDDATRDRMVLGNYALYRLTGGLDASADRPTHAFSSTLEYAGLVYGKAPYLYVALEEELGREELDRRLAQATRAHAWGRVDATSWMAELGAEDEGRRWLKEAWGDEDFELDPEGHKALAILLGPELAESMAASMRMLGMRPQDLFAMLGVSATAPPPVRDELGSQELLKLLDELE